MDAAGKRAKRQHYAEDYSAEVYEEPGQSLELLTEKVNKIARTSFQLSYTSYLLAWLAACGLEKYKKLLDQIELHEVRIPLKITHSVTVEGASNDLRRILFISKDQVMYFGFICDEYVSEKTTYVSYIEKSFDELSFLKPVLRSYAEYVSMIADNWQLQIWADPPEEGSFMFRNKVKATNGPNADKLHSMYKGLLEESGFTGSNYEWNPYLPNLPRFGKKTEPVVREKFETLKKSISDLSAEFNEVFKHTHCVRLEKRPGLKHNFTTQSFSVKKNYDLNKVVDAEDFLKNTKLDYSSKETARKCYEDHISFLKSPVKGLGWQALYHNYKQKSKKYAEDGYLTIARWNLKYSTK